MNTFLRSPYVKTLCCYLALSIAGIFPVSENAWASFIYHQSEMKDEPDPSSLEILQTTLENELIAEKLAELGLSSEEIIRRVEQLNPEERKIVLDGLQTVQVGGQSFFEVLLFLILLPIYILDAITLQIGLVDLIHKYPRKHKYKSRKSSDQYTQSYLRYFPTAEGVDIPSYDGDVKVLINEEPEENTIKVGEIYIKEQGTKEELLGKMKELAAQKGADTILLYTDEPVDDKWGGDARAKRKQLEIEKLDDELN